MEVRRGETNNVRQYMVLLARAEFQMKGTQRSHYGGDRTELNIVEGQGQDRLRGWEKMPIPSSIYFVTEKSRMDFLWGYILK